MTDDDKALAAFLAERLMGWRLVTFVEVTSADVDQTHRMAPRWVDASGADTVLVSHWNPAGIDAHAMLVVHALVDRGLYVCIESLLGDTNPLWRCLVGRNGVYVDAPRFARAIAEAARAALEGEA